MNGMIDIGTESKVIRNSIFMLISMKTTYLRRKREREKEKQRQKDKIEDKIRNAQAHKIP